MYKGHYTERELSNFNGEKDRWASAVLEMANLKIWSDGEIIELQNTKTRKKETFRNIKAIPPTYRTVAELIRKKASKHGGHRLGAGRKKIEGTDLKVPRTIRMTDYEYKKVTEYLADLRQSYGTYER